MKSRILRGGIALTSARLLTRLFDLVRMLTVARWLGPDEMGVYAVGSLVVSALDECTQTGLAAALIQRQGGISPYILPARTVRAARGFLLGLVVFLSAPWMAHFFSSPGSLNILRTIALLPVINGFEPLFQTLSRKELDFTRIVMLQTGATLTALTVGLVAAAVRPDAWAMVWSALTNAFVLAVGAHFLSQPSQLKFSLHWKPLRDLRGFGFWIFISSIIAYSFLKGGDWVIGRLLDTKALALYEMALLISTTATAEVGQVVSNLSLPVFSQLQQDRERLFNAFRQSFGLLSLVTFAMATLVCAASPDLYRLALGNKWLAALPLIPWLTAWGICSIFGSVIAGLFQALGRPKTWVWITLPMLGLFAAGVYPMTRWQGALGVAILMASLGILMQAIRYHLVSRLLSISLMKVFRHIPVPALSCMVSASFTLWARSHMPALSPLPGLILSAACSASLYALLVFFARAWMEPSFDEILGLVKKILPGRMKQD